MTNELYEEGKFSIEDRIRFYRLVKVLQEYFEQAISPEMTGDSANLCQSIADSFALIDTFMPRSC
jgi:hypothetical protein